MLYSGIDIHPKVSYCVVGTAGGEIVKEEKIKSDNNEIEEFYSGLGKVKVVFEATTNYEYFFEVFEALGCEVVLAHPFKTRAIAAARIKTDKISARILMDLLRANLIPASYVPSKDIRDLRKLTRHRIFLGRYRAQMKNRIHAELIKKALQYPGANVFTLKGIEWLKQLNIPLIDSYVSIFTSIDKELKLAESKITISGKTYPQVPLLVTIPGISWYSAMIIYSEIGDITRFSSEQQLFSYAGLVPSVHQSGDNCYYGSITKQGTKNLRWILVETLMVHIKCCPDSKITQFFYRLKKHKPSNVATIAAAKKLLQVIYHMLKNETEFQN